MAEAEATTPGVEGSAGAGGGAGAGAGSGAGGGVASSASAPVVGAVAPVPDAPSAGDKPLARAKSSRTRRRRKPENFWDLPYPEEAKAPEPDAAEDGDELSEGTKRQLQRERDYRAPPAPEESAAFKLATRHGLASDFAPLFSTSSRPWDAKIPLRAYPQYRPASSSIGEAGAAFSRATRDQEKTVFISRAHSAAQRTVKGGPGPDYRHESMMGKQLLSTRKTASRPPFSEAPRPGMHLLYTETGGGRLHLTAMGKNTPTNMPPWVCSRDFVDIQYPNPVSSVGDAIWRPQSPSYSFGASQRKPWRTKTPGPGPIYELPTTIGKAPTSASMKPLVNTVDKRVKVPFTSSTRSSIGVQSLSRNRSAPSFGFGSSSRTGRKKSYLLTDSMAAKGVNSWHRTHRERNYKAAKAHVRKHGFRVHA